MPIWVSFDEFINLLEEAKDWTWGIQNLDDGVLLIIRNGGVTRCYHGPNPFDYDPADYNHFATQINDIMILRGGK